MTRRILASLLSMIIALSSAPDLRAQVAAGAASASVPRVVGALGAGLSAPMLSPLSAPSALALNASLVPSLAIPALSPAPALASHAAAAKGDIAAAPTAAAAAAAETSPRPPALPPASAEEGLSPHEVKVLREAWVAAREWIEPIPDAPEILAAAPIAAQPAREFTPSPEDWRDEVFHFILLDRFARAGKARPHGDTTQGNSRHGGNLRGAIEQLDYLSPIATTLVLSPVMQNPPSVYHGYAPVHLMGIDPHLGTMADFKELVAEAHKRGLKVVLDFVLNHSGPVFEYKEGSKWRGLEGPPKEIGEWTRTLKPADLTDPKHFTRRGVIDDWKNRDQAVNGDFPPNYRHYASDKPATAGALIHIAKWWIQETDIDGFRLDAVRHVAPGFVPVFSWMIKEYAASIGKKDFFLVGEDSTGVDEELVPHVTSNGMNSVFNYPAYRREARALHGKAPTRALEHSLNSTSRALGPRAGQLLRFIDSHDVYRFLRLNEPEAQLKVALAYLLFSIGIPMTYYGTEQGFRQDTDRLEPEGPKHPADPRNREDQFKDGQFKSDSSKGDKFDRTNPIYLWLKKIAEVRKTYAALRRGTQWVRSSDPDHAGIFAFSRVHEGKEVVVILNFSAEARENGMWVDRKISPAGTVYEDVLDSSYRVKTEASMTGSRISVSVPPLSVRVMVRAAN